MSLGEEALSDEVCLWWRTHWLGWQDRNWRNRPSLIIGEELLASRAKMENNWAQQCLKNAINDCFPFSLVSIVFLQFASILPLRRLGWFLELVHELGKRATIPLCMIGLMTLHLETQSWMSSDMPKTLVWFLFISFLFIFSARILSLSLWLISPMQIE